MSREQTTHEISGKDALRITRTCSVFVYSGFVVTVLKVAFVNDSAYPRTKAGIGDAADVCHLAGSAHLDLLPVLCTGPRWREHDINAFVEDG
jgi:hypothetical protein